MTRALALFLFLSGCSVLASKEATVGCQAADTITTVVALNNGAVEANPVVAAIIKIGGIPLFILFKAGVTWLLLGLDRSDKGTEGALAFVNVLTCGVAINNAVIIHQQR